MIGRICTLKTFPGTYTIRGMREQTNLNGWTFLVEANADTGNRAGTLHSVQHDCLVMHEKTYERPAPTSIPGPGEPYR